MDLLEDGDSSIEFTDDAEDPRVQNGHAYDLHGPFEVPENVKKLYFPKYGWEIRRETKDSSRPKSIFFYTETRLHFSGHTTLSIVEKRRDVALSYKSLKKDTISFSISGEMITRDGGSQVFTVAFVPPDLGKVKISEDALLTAPRLGARSTVQDAPWVRGATGWTGLQSTPDPLKVAKNHQAIPYKQ
eukprot:TRINITY_DN3999_c0_g1_i2.p1 TRINITY_DN3999_c0_g1~~TRINITY_DN3999_c0_g1_i2.p1  ORF type:complete len:187 (-),score=11.12 TRINITY_DN3999_c0_g1_i2:24-584(-)